MKKRLSCGTFIIRGIESYSLGWGRINLVFSGIGSDHCKGSHHLWGHGRILPVLPVLRGGMHRPQGLMGLGLAGGPSDQLCATHMVPLSLLSL